MQRIHGEQILLRPAVLADRHMVYEWAYQSDIALYLNPTDESPPDFDTWCRDYQNHYFTEEAPYSGRMFIICHADTPVGMIAYNRIDPNNRVELDIWMDSEANCGRGFGPDAIETLCVYLANKFDVHTFMMQPSARNPRAIRAYEKAGFVRKTATPEEIQADWGAVDGPDSVLMVRQEYGHNSHSGTDDS